MVTVIVYLPLLETANTWLNANAALLSLVYVHECVAVSSSCVGNEPVYELIVPAVTTTDLNPLLFVLVKLIFTQSVVEKLVP